MIGLNEKFWNRIPKTVNLLASGLSNIMSKLKFRFSDQTRFKCQFYHSDKDGIEWIKSWYLEVGDVFIGESLKVGYDTDWLG